MHILVETEQRYKKGKKIVQVCFLLLIITYIYSIGFELLSNNISTAFLQVIVLAFLSGMMYLAYTGVKWSKFNRQKYSKALDMEREIFWLQGRSAIVDLRWPSCGDFY